MELIENCVEQDDAGHEAYLEGNEPDTATLKKLIRKATAPQLLVRSGRARPARAFSPLDVVGGLSAEPAHIPPWRVLSGATRLRKPCSGRHAPSSAPGVQDERSCASSDADLRAHHREARDFVAGLELGPRQEEKAPAHVPM